MRAFVKNIIFSLLWEKTFVGENVFLLTLKKTSLFSRERREEK